MISAVARRHLDIVFGQHSEILEQQSVQLVALLPSTVQSYTRFAAGIAIASNQPQAAGALIAYLSSPDARKVMQMKGIEAP